MQKGLIYFFRIAVQFVVLCFKRMGVSVSMRKAWSKEEKSEKVLLSEIIIRLLLLRDISENTFFQFHYKDYDNAYFIAISLNKNEF